MLQQYLPFTVLKRPHCWEQQTASIRFVATVLTVYGIETGRFSSKTQASPLVLQQYLPFTVLKQVETVATNYY